MEGRVGDGRKTWRWKDELEMEGKRVGDGRKSLEELEIGRKSWR